MLPEHYSSLRTRRSFIRQALCAAVGTAALTNTIRDLRFINAAMAQSSPAITDYKALVCMFLQGGNDANNLFIPTIPAEWHNYAAIRTPALAIPNTDGSGATALALNNLTSDGHTYGIHPAAPELQSLFNNGKMAAILNVGTLVYPLTKADYSNPLVAKPLQLFSHVDQAVQWQTSVSDRQSPTGWGGRCADLLDTYNPKNNNTDVLSMSISLAGANVFEVGGVAQQYSVSTGGVVALNSGYTPTNARTAQGIALNNILGIDAVQADMLTRNYSLALGHALASGTALSTALTATKMASTWSSYPTSVTVPNGGGSFGSSLSQQLKMVAQIIEAGQRSAAAGGLGMKRQIFFVQVGGYDLHSGQTSNSGSTTVNNAAVIQGGQANLFAELSQSLNNFQNAMQQIGAKYNDSSFEKRVTAFTASEFGRTLPSNGVGSDHGWGSHHLVVRWRGERAADVRQVSRAGRRRPGRHEHRPLDSHDGGGSIRRHDGEMVRGGQHEHGHGLPESGPVRCAGPRLHGLANASVRRVLPGR